MTVNQSSMDLQSYLHARFLAWCPDPPVAVVTTKRTITLKWNAEPFEFISDKMIYRVERREKIPPWVVAYSGGKKEKLIDNLPPRHPQKFRIKIILQSIAVTSLAERAIKAFGEAKNVYEHFEQYDKQRLSKGDSLNNERILNLEKSIRSDNTEDSVKKKEYFDRNEDIDINRKNIDDKSESVKENNINGTKERTNVNSDISKPWLESGYSEETWTSTETDGTSATCFCMAVKCGYLKQVQIMLEERPELIGIINSKNGFTPLATAVKKGELSMVKFLLNVGAEVEQRGNTQQTPLQLAILEGRVDVASLLLDRGADPKARDLNGLRAEHYAVDSGSVDMLRLVLDRNGDVTVTDSNGWTPLFRAICQGASTEMVSELISRGSDVTVADYAGLPLTTAARLLKNRHGRGRDSILRLVDAQYPHEKALEHFTRLTKKISSVNTMFK